MLCELTARTVALDSFRSGWAVNGSDLLCRQQPVHGTVEVPSETITLGAWYFKKRRSVWIVFIFLPRSEMFAFINASRFVLPAINFPHTNAHSGPSGDPAHETAAVSTKIHKAPIKIRCQTGMQALAAWSTWQLGEQTIPILNSTIIPCILPPTANKARWAP